MPFAVIGMRVLSPRVSGDNGDVDRAIGLVSEVGGEGPNGGVMIKVRLFPNATDVSLFLDNVELMTYEGEARALGPDLGAWPNDYP